MHDIVPFPTSTKSPIFEKHHRNHPRTIISLSALTGMNVQMRRSNPTAQGRKQQGQNRPALPQGEAKKKINKSRSPNPQHFLPSPVGEPKRLTAQPKPDSPASSYAQTAHRLLPHHITSHHITSPSHSSQLPPKTAPRPALPHQTPPPTPARPFLFPPSHPPPVPNPSSHTAHAPTCRSPSTRARWRRSVCTG